MNWKHNKILSAHVLTANKTLLNCPFCNGTAKLRNTYTSWYWIECQKCQCEVAASTPPKADNDIDAHIASIKNAIEKWNRRNAA